VIVEWLQILQTVIAGLWKYGPAIAAFLDFLNARRAQGDAEIGTDLERGFRVLTKTKSPTALYNAVASRCGDDGCLLPPPSEGEPE
jgi:hypothetical protein